MLVDDHPSIRVGIRPGLESGGFAQIVAEAGDGEEAVRIAIDAKPDVVLMDLNLPKMSGIEATRQIIAELTTCKVLVFSSAADEPHVLEAIKAGASGYVLKTAHPLEVVEAVRQVHQGQLHFTPSLAGMVLEELRRQSSLKLTPKEHALTQQERQVLELSEKGVSMPEIAKKLNMSPPRVVSLQNSATEKMRSASQG